LRFWTSGELDLSPFELEIVTSVNYSCQSNRFSSKGNISSLPDVKNRQEMTHIPRRRLALIYRDRLRVTTQKRGFHPKQRTQRKERNDMTSLSDRPTTVSSDDGVCRWYAAKLWQTRQKIRNY